MAEKDISTDEEVGNSSVIAPTKYPGTPNPAPPPQPLLIKK